MATSLAKPSHYNALGGADPSDEAVQEIDSPTPRTNGHYLTITVVSTLTDRWFELTDSQ